jgi:hypothetical protein
VVVEPVLVFDVDRVGIKLFDLLRDGNVSILAAHINYWVDVCSFAVGVRYDVDRTAAQLGLDELHRFFDEGRDSTWSGRVAAYDN